MLVSSSPPSWLEDGIGHRHLRYGTRLAEALGQALLESHPVGSPDISVLALALLSIPVAGLLLPGKAPFLSVSGRRML